MSEVALLNEQYDGPNLSVEDLVKPFWDNEKKVPLGGTLKVKLLYVIDGDTAVFSINGQKETVRLFIIDTPELRPNEEPYAIEAKIFLEQVLQNASEIILQSDIYDDLRDVTESKRLLAWLWVDGELVNYLLVKAGLAKVRYIASPNLKYLKELFNAEKEAKQLELKLHKRK